MGASFNWSLRLDNIDEILWHKMVPWILYYFWANFALGKMSYIELLWLFTHKTSCKENVSKTHLLDTAIEPFPCRQTISDEKTSGMDVPTAKNDSPMTESEINQACSLTH